MKKKVLILIALMFAALTAFTSSSCTKSTSINIVQDSINLMVGNSEKLKLEYDKSNNYVFSFTSDNPSVASIDKEGNVVGVSVGTTIVRVKPTIGEAFDYAIVVVQADNISKYIESIFLSKTNEVIIRFSSGQEYKTGVTVFNGREIELQVANDYIQWRYVGESTWNNLISLQSLVGPKGNSAKQTEFRVSDGWIQWSYVGEDTWNNLVSLSTLVGPKGESGKQTEFRVFDGWIQWSYVGEVTWNNLVSLSTLVGPKGESGKQTEFRVFDGWIQWSYVGDNTWNNLVDLASLIKENCKCKEVTFQVNDGWIQWGYKGSNEWTDLVDLSTLKGNDGNTGESAYEIYIRNYPGYPGTEEQWITELAYGKLVINIELITNNNSLPYGQESEFTILKGQALTLPDLEISNGIFLGWYLNSSYTTSFVQNSYILKNAKIYAKTLNWEATDITYGESLSKSTLAFTNAPYAGSIKFDNPSYVPAHAGRYSAAVTFTPDNPNNATIYGFIDINVERKLLTVNVDNKTVTYGDVTPELTYTITGFVNGDTSSVVSGNPTLTTAYTSTTPVSSSPIAITASSGTLEASNYNFEFVNGEITINKKTLTVNADNKNTTYGDVTPELTYTITGFANDENESVVFGTPTLTTIYTSTTPVSSSPKITFSSMELTADNYDFEFVDGEVTINKKTLTVTANEKYVTYGDETPTLTYKITGFVNGENLSVVSGLSTLTTTYTSTTQVSEGPVLITFNTMDLTATNYDFEYVDGYISIYRRTLNVIVDNKTVTYGDEIPTLTYTINGFVNGEDEEVVLGYPTLTTTYTSTTPVSSSPVVITASYGTLEASNYDFNIIYGSITINKKTLTVSADDRYVTYGDSKPILTCSVTGFVNGDDFLVISGAFSLTTTYTPATPVSSSPKITFSSMELAAANYNFEYVDGYIYIAKKTLTVTANDHYVTYGDSKPVLTFEVLGFVNGENSSVVSGTATFTSTYTSTTPVGSGSVLITLGESNLTAANYDFEYVDGYIYIAKKMLTVSADCFVVTYGDETPTLTYTIYGFVNGEDELVVSGNPTLTTTYTSTTPVSSSSVLITASYGTLEASNYDFEFVDGEITINKKTLTVTAYDKYVTYGDSNPDLTYKITGLVNGENLSVVFGTVTLSTTYTSTTPVSSSPVTITFSTKNLTAANYDFTYVDGDIYIAKRTLYIFANSYQASYGESYETVKSKLSYYVLNLLDGDNLANVLSELPNMDTDYTSSTLANDVKNIYFANEKDIISTNYEVYYENSDLFVNPALLTVKINPYTINYGYDINYNLVEYTITGFKNGDDINVVSGRPTFNSNYRVDTPAGAKNIYIYVESVKDGLFANNYVFEYIIGLITVEKRTVNVYYYDAYVTYGDSTVDYYWYTYQFDYANYNDYLSVTGNPTFTLTYLGSPYTYTSSTPVSMSGELIISASVGTLAADNYDFNMVNEGYYYGSRLYIMAKELTVTGLLSENKIYNGTNSASLFVNNQGLTYYGIINNDDVGVSLDYAYAYFYSSNPGYNIPVYAQDLTLTGKNAENYFLSYDYNNEGYGYYVGQYNIDYRFMVTANVSNDIYITFPELISAEAFDKIRASDFKVEITRNDVTTNIQTSIVLPFYITDTYEIHLLTPPANKLENGDVITVTLNDSLFSKVSNSYGFDSLSETYTLMIIE